MSNSPFFQAGKNSGKPAPEKSKFAQTCNLLSQYMKEKGKLSDLNFRLNGKLEITGKNETTTMNLLTRIESCDRISTQEMNTMDVLPQYSNAVGNKEDASNIPSSSKSPTMEAKTAQMTIFYAGQVFVFNDFSTEKAREVMNLASKVTANKTDQTQDSDLPIARRASLHRFFEKKKERATSRAPYQLHNPAAESHKNDREEFDLNL